MALRVGARRTVRATRREVYGAVEELDGLLWSIEEEERHALTERDGRPRHGGVGRYCTLVEVEAGGGRGEPTLDQNATPDQSARPVICFRALTERGEARRLVL